MDRAIHETATACGWKLQTLLRSTRFFTAKELVTLYKSHVLSFIEYRTAAIYHASNTVLAELDNVQKRMLKIVAATEEEALFHFNLAPLCTRQDIAMLGIIHRAAIGQGPRQLQQFFYQAEATQSGPKRTRLQHLRHAVRLGEFRDGSHTEYVNRSALGLDNVYNLLPQKVLCAVKVSDFQRLLQDMVKERASRDDRNWKHLFSPRQDMTQHMLVRS
jgi:hypothetical protein